MSSTPSFSSLKRVFLNSGYEVRNFTRNRLEELALDAPTEVKRHQDSNIMGLILPDEMIIGIARDLTDEEKAVTLLHELLHLWDPELDEESVEELTIELEQQLSPGQFGFLQFLAS